MKKENKALARQKRADAKKRQALKKKILTIGGILLAVVLVVGTLAAIKISNDEAKAPETLKFSKYLTEEGKIKGVNLDKYVELGDLDTILQLKKEDIAPSEDAVWALMEGFLSYYQELNTEKGIVLEDGDTVQIQYVGTVDGVAFEGGSTGEEGTKLTLGSGSYIDGFEDQLIGKKVGDEVEVKVTFPEDYGNETLNGKDAVFAVIVDGVYGSEVTDELVAKNVEGCSTVEEYYQLAYETIYDSNLETLVWNEIYENVSISDYPKKYAQNMVDMITYHYEQEFISVNQQYYEYYGQYMWETMAQFYEEYYGMTSDDVMAAIESDATNEIAYMMICQAISEAKGVTSTEEDRVEFITNYGYTEEQMDEAVAAYGEGYIAQGAMALAVERYVISSAVVSE